MRVFLDESGFTGQDLFNREQPIFTVASTNLSDAETSQLWQQLFSKTQAPEIKHSTLAKAPGGQRLVVELVSWAVGRPTRFTAYVAHKRFCLLAKLIDLWAEPAMHGDGVDLYESGGNIAFSNMAYFCLEGFESREFLDRHLKNFQRMMRERTPDAYENFWVTLARDLENRRNRLVKSWTSFLLLRQSWVRSTFLTSRRSVWILPLQSLSELLSTGEA